MKRIIIYILLSLGIYSCIGRFQSPQVDMPEEYIYAEPQTADSSVHVETSWWEIFGDTTLNFLINTALENNRDLAVASSKVEQAKLSLGVTRSQFLPQFNLEIDAKGDYSRQTKISEQYSVQPSAAWEISLFGAMKHSTQAAKAEILSEWWAQRGVMLSLAAQVAETYFTLLQYENCLEISSKSYNLRASYQAITDSLFSYGMSSAVDVRQAESLTQTAAVNIPQYERAIAQTTLTLCTLTGQNPATADSYTANATMLYDTPPPDIPAGLPSSLLENRPDIMQQYYNVRQTFELMGVARAQQFPSIALTAQGGVAAASLKGLTGSNPFVWSAAASIVEPLFMFGQKRRNFQISQQENRQAVLQYEQTVLTALQDVESALVAIQTYRTQTDQYATLLEYNNEIQYMTRQLYDRGMTSYLEVIDAERTLYNSQLEYVNILAQQYINYVSLYKALGGGWQ